MVMFTRISMLCEKNVVSSTFSLMRTKFLSRLLCGWLLLLTACSSYVRVDMITASTLNPDAHHRSLPVQVKIYQLKDQSDFAQASFRDLWLNDKTILGDSLLSSQSLMLSPSRLTSVRLQPVKGIHYVGMIAIFRQPPLDNWRVMKKLWGQFAVIKVALAANEITILS